LSASASSTVGPVINDTLHGSEGAGKSDRYQIQMHGQAGQRTLSGICWLYSHVGPDSINYRFTFSAESPALLSVALAHAVSAECVTSLFVLLSVSTESEISAFGRPLLSNKSDIYQIKKNNYKLN